MTFNEAVMEIKGRYSGKIFSSFGYDDLRKKYTALEPSMHNNDDLNPSMGLHPSGDSFFLKDFAGEQKKYSSIDLIMIAEKLSFADAVRRGAEICGIVIDDSNDEELFPDMKFIVSGLYAKAKREGFSVKVICSKHHYYYKDAEGKKLFDKYRIDYILGDGKKRKHIHQGIEQNGFVRKFKLDEYKSLIAMYGDFRQYHVGERVYIPEGEECVKSCHRKGMQNVVTAGSANDWKYKGKKFATFFKGTDVVILQDNDSAGETLTRDIISSLKGVAASIKVVVPDRSKEKADIADFFLNGGTIQQLEEMIAETPVWEGKKPLQEDGTNTSEVKSLLSYDERGKILQTVKNFEIVLENDKRFSGKIGFDEFSRQISLMGSVPWDTLGNKFRAWSNHDDSALFSILQSDYGLRSRNDFFDAVKIVAARNCFHPVRELLDSLPYKGDGYIRKLLPDYLGVEDTEYQYQVMKLWMLGAVSRIYSSGCKFDYTIILEGPQGIGKSTFLRLLALDDNWFNDSLDNLDSDKSAQSLMGSWILELAELKSLARTSGGSDSIKRFLSAQQDKYRAPYERRAEIIQRQCVFAGTTNRADFLQDETGNRRFLIIETGANKPTKSLFASEAMDDIKGAWAEAVHIMKSENSNLILPEEYREEAEKLQAASMADDGKSGLIQVYLENKQRTCAIEIWQEALNESGRPAKWQASEINSIVSSIPGWRKMKSPGRFGEFGMQRGFELVDKDQFVDSSLVSDLPFN